MSTKIPGMVHLRHILPHSLFNCCMQYEPHQEITCPRDYYGTLLYEIEPIQGQKGQEI